tara:strand:- start:89 stop:496 length:408 start_codon:yes stop_codon:yes gene_type:complete
MGNIVKWGNKKFPELGNFYPCEFVINNETWNSTEQYYQAMKSDDIYYRTKIKKETDGLECWIMGQEIVIRDDWDKVKVDIMYKANLAKFKQNKKLRNILISTEGELELNNGSFWDYVNKWILESLKDYFKEDKND